MKRAIAIGIGFASMLLTSASALAQAHIEFIDMGTPKNGAVVMNWWHGVIVRVVLENGSPITRVDFPAPGDTRGNLAQRWIDPAGQGNYTVTSPGPLGADNTSDSEFNFDSHFLGSPDEFTVLSAVESFRGPFLTSRTGLTSDGFVGYGASAFVNPEPDPIILSTAGHLSGSLFLNSGFQSDTVDIAYLVTDGGFFASGVVYSGDAGFGVSRLFEVPEPGAIGAAIFASVLSIAFRRKRVERSTDGTNSWQTITPGLLQPGTTEFTNPRIDANLAFYRVSDTDGTNSATSAAVRETVPMGVTGQKLEAEAEPVPGFGVRIKWEHDSSAAGQSDIYIFRKSITDTIWPTTPLLTRYNAGDIGYYDDVSAGTGIAYEYCVTTGLRSSSGYPERYLYAGNAKGPDHSRGTTLLVIDQTLLDSDGQSLQGDVTGFTSDLVGEGYQVITRTVPRADVLWSGTTWKDAVQSTKAEIRDVYNHYALSSVILIGHVAVPYSGIDAADGHGPDHGDHQGAWPTDVYYGVLSSSESFWTDSLTASNTLRPANDNHPGDGKFDPDSLADGNGQSRYDAFGHEIKADVAIGRIDFTRTTVNGIQQAVDVGLQPSSGELSALHAYFVKDHAYRIGQWNIRTQTLIDRYSDWLHQYQDPTLFAANVGMANVKNGRIGVPPLGDHLGNDLNNDTWLCAYMTGGGSRSSNYDGIQFDAAGTRRLDATFYTGSVGDFGKHQSVFNLVYGSFIGDWDWYNSLLRTAIAEPAGFGLVSMWGSNLIWDLQRMGLGGTIGDSLLATEDDRGIYDTDGSFGGDGPTNGVTDPALMGDPTLRQDVVKPVSAVNAVSGVSGNVITWTASPDSGVDGYYIYRATDPYGTWTLCNSSGVVTSTTYTDANGPTSVDGYYYMVRADKLTTTPSGSYYNLSVGQISQPVFVNKSTAFDWDGHVPTTDNPWKQWIDLKFSQDLLFPADPASWLSISGQLWQSGSFTAKTLVYNTDYKLVDDPAARTKRIVFLNPTSHAADFAPNGIWTLTLPSTLANAFCRTLSSDDRTLSFNFLIADANYDCICDFTDLVPVSQHYNQADPSGDSPRPWGDLNGDGIVNFDDLVMVSQYYGVSLFD